MIETARGEVEDGADLAERLVGAWGSWGATLSPGASRMAFVSDRNGVPQIFVQDLARGTDCAEPCLIELGDDPVVSVHWSADGGWLSAEVATSGGVRTQVWVVRPDGSQARRIAGSPAIHAQLGPWTRSGHRVAVTIPGTRAGEPGRAYLAVPATGELTLLAEGDLISVLDMSVDEQLVVLRDGERGKQFCVVVDRFDDADHPLLPYPAIGSTERAILRPSPDPEPGRLIAYLATDAGLARRQCVALPLGQAGWRGQSGILAPRDDAELEDLDADDAGRLLLLVWNVA